MTAKDAIVIDASALLAFLQAESGEDEVADVLGQAVMSSVNYSEVCQRLLRHDRSIEDLLPSLEALGLGVISFDATDAEIAASLSEETARLGLGLADRACLALGIRYELPVLTADRAWTELQDIPVPIRLVRL